jgi:hypothetical protein
MAQSNHERVGKALEILNTGPTFRRAGDAGEIWRVLAYNSLVTSWLEISRLAHREASDQGLWGATYLG